MYAVIATGGKQYKVAKDDIIIVEKLDTETGKKVSFDDVLMCGTDADVTVGAPTIAGAKVSGEVIEQRKGDKVLVFKKKPRKGFKRLKGHRQYATKVKIEDIVYGG